MKRYILPILVMAAALLASCGDNTKFTVAGRFTDGADRYVTMTYFDGSGVKEVNASAINGSFRVSGVAPAYALLTIIDASTQTPYVSAIARNGDAINLEIDASEPVNCKARGNKPSEAFNAFIRDNAEPILNGREAVVNRIVSDYIVANPDGPESTAMLTNLFFAAGHEQKADSLLRLLGPEARSRALIGSFAMMLASQLDEEATSPVSQHYLTGPDNKRVRLSPRDASLTLYAFSDDDATRVDSTTMLLRELTGRYPVKRFHGIALSSASDSLSWAVKVSADTTVVYDRVWTPVLLADRDWKRLAIPRRPYFIVVDSVGSQLLRTGSASRARSFIINRLDR